LGNIIKENAKKTTATRDRRLYFMVHYYPSTEFAWEFYRFELLRLYLKKYSRNELIMSAIRLFVYFFEDLIVKNKDDLPSLDFLIKFAATPDDPKTLLQYKEWLDLERLLVEVFQKDTKIAYKLEWYLELEKSRKMLHNVLDDIIDAGIFIEKGKFPEEKIVTKTTMLKRLSAWVEGKIKK
jgi:hypothetical protein